MICIFDDNGSGAPRGASLTSRVTHSHTYHPLLLASSRIARCGLAERGCRRRTGHQLARDTCRSPVAHAGPSVRRRLLRRRGAAPGCARARRSAASMRSAGLRGSRGSLTHFPSAPPAEAIRASTRQQPRAGCRHAPSAPRPPTAPPALLASSPHTAHLTAPAGWRVSSRASRECRTAACRWRRTAPAWPRRVSRSCIGGAVVMRCK